MSQTHTDPGGKGLKRHGNPLDSAISGAPIEKPKSPSPDFEPSAAVPPAEEGGHSHSAAAHLHIAGKPHTKPEGVLRNGAPPDAIRQPPSIVQRVGKGRRGE